MSKRLFIINLVSVVSLLLFLISLLVFPETKTQSVEETMTIVFMVMSFVSFFVSFFLVSIFVTINYNQQKTKGEVR
jgi:hypothetical protein